MNRSPLNNSIICVEAVRRGLQAEDREDAILQLLLALADAGEIEHADLEELSQSILSRETLGSTDLGHGIAIPYTKHARVRKTVGAVGVFRGGITAESPGPDRVRLLVLLLFPADQPSQQLRTLEELSMLVRDTSLRQRLQQAESANEIVELLGTCSHLENTSREWTLPDASSLDNPACVR